MAAFDAEYQRARKSLWQVRQDLDAFEASASLGTGSATDADQQGVSQRLAELQQCVQHLQSSLSSVPAAKRHRRKIEVDNLDDEVQSLTSTHSRLMHRHTRVQRERNEREQLLSRRHVPGTQGNGSDVAIQINESKALAASHAGIDQHLAVGSAILTDLRMQGSRLKTAQRRVLDLANTLGLSNSLIRVIERRSATDTYIFLACSVLTTILLFYMLFWYR